MQNTGTLALVLADFLGIQHLALKKVLCTVFSNPDGASSSHDDPAKTLSSLLLTWLNEHISQHLCRDEFYPIYFDALIFYSEMLSVYV